MAYFTYCTCGLRWVVVGLFCGQTKHDLAESPKKATEQKVQILSLSYCKYYFDIKVIDLWWCGMVGDNMYLSG